MSQAKGDTWAQKDSVKDNFDEILKVFEGNTELQGQERKFFHIYVLWLLYLLTLKKRGLPIAIVS